MDKLPSLTSSAVINKLKQVFARHGIPEDAISDNGPQYASREFSDFAKEWKFQHRTSSPRYPQSNGLAEKTVQTAKNILEKNNSNCDVFLALLEYRNTPVDNLASPAQLSMSRRLRSVLPNSTNQLIPDARNINDDISHRNNRQQRQQVWYNKSAKVYDELQEGDQVRVLKDSRWIPGKIQHRFGNRSYGVEVADGSTYRRNRRHIFPSVQN